jgi:hypothetical protein
MHDDPGSAEPLVGAIRGFRWWRLSGSWLTSPWRGEFRWARDGNAASCLGRRLLLRWRPHGVPHGRGIPESACSCGFYAMLQAPIDGVEAPVTWPLNPSLSGGPISLVFGAVRGTGRVILGEYGWRAERARVDALYLPPWRHPSEPFQTVADAYDVPIYQDLRTLSEERGPDAWTRDLARLPGEAGVA